MKSVVIRTPDLIRQQFASKAMTCRYIEWRLLEHGILAAFVCCPKHRTRLMTFAVLSWEHMHYTWMTKAYSNFVSVASVLTRLLHRRVKMPKTHNMLETASNPDCGQEKSKLDPSDFFHKINSDTKSPSYINAYRIVHGKKK